MFYSAFCFAEVFEKLFNVKPMFPGFLSCKQTEKSAFYTTPWTISQLAAFPPLSVWQLPSPADRSLLVQLPSTAPAVAWLRLPSCCLMPTGRAGLSGDRGDPAAASFSRAGILPASVRKFICHGWD